MKHLLWILLAICGAVAAGATTVKPMSVEELTAAATDIVEARALESWTSWNPQHTLIYTFTKLEVSRSLKGSARQIVVLRQLGGRVGPTTQTVAGVRYPAADEERVMFLRPSVMGDGTMVVVGLMQGNFAVRRVADTGEAIVSNGVSGAHVMSESGAIERYQGSGMTLQQLESRVRRALGQ